MAALDYPVTRQTYPVDGDDAVNLIAELEGSDQAKEIVLLGAHYDTVETTPGADDNASAVAVLIEVARLLRQSSPRRVVRFAAFTCEEPPHFHTATMGSQVYARQCRAEGERILGMLCLEMVGYYSNDPGSQGYPTEMPRWLRWVFPRRGNFLAAVSNLRSWKLGLSFRRGFKRAARFPLYSIALPEVASFIRLSDNSSFWDQGYPAMMITDTSFLRNPHYHASTDLPETLDYGCMSEVTYGVAGGVARLSGAAFVRPK
ncbi:MAG: M28 family peptidase [Planctomycetota bacterium]